MFTGIVSDIGTIARVERRGDLRVHINCGYDMDAVDLGASIACGGVCLTVVDKAPGRFAVDVSAETVAKTSPCWEEGTRLNLERALRLGDELGGHIVTGHVDGVGEIEELERVGDSTRLIVTAGPEIAPYVATKGSITLDGVSLTVNELLFDVQSTEGVGFALNIIPHTASATTLGDLYQGDRVNLEIDVLARYLRRLEALRAA